MHTAMFLPINGLLEHFADKLFAPFKDSLLIFQKVAQTGQHSDIENSDNCGIINDDDNNYNPNQERDENGRWVKEGGGSSSNNSVSQTSTEKTSSKSRINIQLFAKVPQEKLSNYSLDPRLVSCYVVKRKE